jgi:ubiquinone/menaquinone biosynthesis C-methylase UbiE
LSLIKANAFADFFSGHAVQYAAARPAYPATLFAFIAAQAPATARAWDCGTGNGQAAVALARHFDQVQATDPSPQQIAQAAPHTAVAYSVQRAERSSFPAATFDAVCVAQALHWFDLSRFFAEAERVMKPGALFAAWGYSWFAVDPVFDALFRDWVLAPIAADWAPQNRLLWDGYRQIQLPFAPVESPPLAILLRWNLNQLLAYVHTWSAVRRAAARLGPAFLTRAAAELAGWWGDPEISRPVSMPLTFLAGRKR